MSSLMCLSDREYKNLATAAGLFLGGGIAYYIYIRLFPEPTSAQRHNECLTRQIHEVKHEITALKQSLNDAVYDVRKELDGIRGAVSQKLSISDSALVGIEAVCARVDVLHERSDEDKERALRILQEQELIYPNSCELMWRLARAHVAMYELQEDSEVKQIHATTALNYAHTAVSLDHCSVNAHKWCAIALGIATDFVGTKEKIEGGYELKTHIDRAIELDPNQAILHYMKGRWCWGVYQLTWIERKLAATLFATPPCSTIDEALECFLRAEELEPGFYKGNQLYLAKCYYEKKEYYESKRWAEAAIQIVAVTKDDKEMHTEAENLLKKLL